RRHDVDRLDPPHHPVAPVAPLVGDQRLPDRPSVAFGDPVASRGAVVEQRDGPLAQHGGIEPDVFGFVGERQIRLHDEGQVRGGGRTNAQAQNTTLTPPLITRPSSGAHASTVQPPPGWRAGRTSGSKLVCRTFPRFSEFRNRCTGPSRRSTSTP